MAAPLLETIMDLVASLPATPKAWLLNSLLAPHMDAFVAHLRRGRYATKTTKSHLLGVAHFSRWMTQSSLPVSLLNEQTVLQCRRQSNTDHLGMRTITWTTWR